MTRSGSPFLLLLLLLPLLHITTVLVAPSIAIDILNPTQPLVDGQILVSSNDTFVLGFFSPDGSSNRYVGIWYHESKVSIPTVVWVANRALPLRDHNGSLQITGNGTLYIAHHNSTITIRAPPTSNSAAGLRNPVARLLDNGNLVVLEAAGSTAGNSFAWQSFDYPTDTQLPGMKVGWDRRAGLDRKLIAWKRADDPAPGDVAMVMDTHGYPQKFLESEGTGRVYWRSGPWNGLRFVGIPDMSLMNLFVHEYVQNQDEAFYLLGVKDPSTFFRLTVHESGNEQGFLWIQKNKAWNLIWDAPKDRCDGGSPCGANGICDANKWPICSCLRGFEPKDPKTWAAQGTSDGCLRKTALGCLNGTDGLVKVEGAKLPDTSSSWVDTSLNLEQCKAKCLSNCSCTACATANISNGMGCIFWNTDLVGLRINPFVGQDLFLRLAASDLLAAKSHDKEKVVVAVSLGGGVVVMAIVACYVCRRLAGRHKMFPHRSRTRATMIRSTSQSYRGGGKEDGNDDDEVELPTYDFETIAAATDDFSSYNLLGEGGFGFVYKGKLNGKEIAVKRLSSNSLQGINEFKNEVILIAKLQHRNLVRLLGCCIDGKERMLIYEYMPNKSLDSFLFEKDNACRLCWEVRHNIILGIARGLLYLHQDSRFRIIHRDLKASNVLLDKDMNPKISDFGLARIFSNDNAANMTRRVVGTYGYMAPEYAMNGIFSVKSDVFSFGVLVLEIITGVKNRGAFHFNPENYLLGKAWSLWNEGRSLELVDQSIGDVYPPAEVSRFVKLGLLCVQEFPEDRPTMATVLAMLGSDNMMSSPPKIPGFVGRRRVTTSTDDELTQLSSADGSKQGSVNDLTISMPLGR